MPQQGPLGRLVRNRRKELKLTQPEIAERVGCSPNDISRLECGRTQRVNDPGRLDALAKALGLEDDIGFILAAYAPPEGYERWRQEAGAPEAAMIELIRDWPEPEKERAVRVVTALPDPLRRDDASPEHP
jgi:transcriptional regulator with XRE-family HTH domain